MQEDRYAKLNAKIEQEKKEGLSPAERDRRAAEKAKEKQKIKITQTINLVPNESLLDDDDQEYYIKNDFLEKDKHSIWNKKYISKQTYNNLEMFCEQEWYNKYLYAVKIFKKNNRIKIHNISKEDDRYTETHHIIPRSLGGSDNKDNLVEVSWNEHALLHILLCRAYPYNNKLYSAIIKMLYAANEYEKDYFLEGYEVENRKEKMEELLSRFVLENVIDKDIYNY